MMNEVMGPDMVSMPGPSPDAGPIVQPQSPPLGLLLRHFQAFLPPEPFDSLVVNIPAFPSKQRCDPSIAVAAELCGQRDDSSNEPGLILRRLELAALRRSRLFDHTTRPSFRDSEPFASVLNGSSSLRRTQKFPRETSARICLSSDRSATSFFGRPFSFSSSLRRLAWSMRTPP